MTICINFIFVLNSAFTLTGTSEFSLTISQVFSTYFARVFWSDLVILDNYGLNKPKKHGSQNV